jgi:hypothetical protein
VGHLDRVLKQLSLRDQTLSDMARLDNPLGSLYVYIYAYILSRYAYMHDQMLSGMAVLDNELGSLYIYIYIHIRVYVG